MNDFDLTSFGNQLKKNEDKFLEIIKKGKADNFEEMKVLTLFSFNIIEVEEDEDSSIWENQHKLFSNNFYKYLYENQDICEKILELFKKEEKELALTFLYTVTEKIKIIKNEYINGNIYNEEKNIMLKLFSENLLNENFVYSSFMDEKDDMCFETIDLIHECFDKFQSKNKIVLFREICNSIFEDEIVDFENEIIDILCELIDILNRENITIIWNHQERFNLYTIKRFIYYKNLYDNEKVLKIMRFCFSEFIFNIGKNDWKNEDQLTKLVNYCKKLFEGKDFEFDYAYDDYYKYSPFIEDNFFLQYINPEKLHDEQLIKSYNKYGYFKEEYDKRNLNDNILQDV